MGSPEDQDRSLPRRLIGRVGRAVLKAAGGAVYYAIYRRLPDDKSPDPYWSEMHPDDDKGQAGEAQRFTQAPPSI